MHMFGAEDCGLFKQSCMNQKTMEYSDHRLNDIAISLHGSHDFSLPGKCDGMNDVQKT
jgi:hypothetical protein